MASKQVLVVSDNEYLIGRIKHWATTNYAAVLISTEGTDCIVNNADILIMDRLLISKEKYAQYLAYVKSVNGEEIDLTAINDEDDRRLCDEMNQLRVDQICIIVDDSKILELPLLDQVIVVDRRTFENTNWMNGLITN